MGCFLLKTQKYSFFTPKAIAYKLLKMYNKGSNFNYLERKAIMNISSIQEQILKLKKEKDVCILAWLSGA